MTTLTQLAQQASQKWIWSGEEKDVIKSILDTPLYKGEWYWILPNEATIEYAKDDESYTAEYVTIENLKVVYWGEHPSDDLLEWAIENGEVTDDEVCDPNYVMPTEMLERGCEMLREVLGEWIEEDLELKLDLSGEVEYYSTQGGYYIETCHGIDIKVDCPALMLA